MDSPDAYVRGNAAQRRDVAAILAEFAPRLSFGDNESVLDVGCGTGDVTMDILKPVFDALGANYSLLGVDINADMVDFANKTLKNADKGVSHAAKSNEGAKGLSRLKSIDLGLKEAPRLSFETMDITREVEKEKLGKFTKLFSFFCFHWIQQQKLAWTNVNRLMAKGAEGLVVFVASVPLFQAYRELAKQELYKDIMHDAEHFISPFQDDSDPAHTLAEIVRECGLEIVSCESRRRDYKFADKEVFKKMARGVSPFSGRMDEKQGARYLDDLADALVTLKDVQVDEQGGIKIDHSLFVVHFKK